MDRPLPALGEAEPRLGGMAQSKWDSLNRSDAAS
jgi:hypothetical protein